MANRATLCLCNATSVPLVPLPPPYPGAPPGLTSSISKCVQMDSWWFGTVGPKGYASFEIVFEPRDDEENDKGLALFMLPLVTTPPTQTNNINIFVLNALSDRTRRHFLRLQTQDANLGTVVISQAPLVVAVSRGSAVHAASDPTDVSWYPLGSFPKNTGIPFGSGTSYTLSPANDPPADADNDALTMNSPDGYPNGYITQDGMVFGLALVDPALLFPNNNWQPYYQAISTYCLSYVQSKSLQQALKTCIFGQ